MIGQETLIQTLDRYIENGRMPHFIILIGEKGSGRRTLSQELARKLKLSFVEILPKVDDVRALIATVNSATIPTMYFLGDVDNMSPASANAMLKITEECPDSAYIILSCESLDNVLDTLQSRAVSYYFEPSSYWDKCDYLRDVYPTQFADMDDADAEFILGAATTMDDLNKFMSLDVKEHIAFVNKVLDNIGNVTIANGLKLAQEFNFRDDIKKCDLRLFLKSFNSICADRMTLGEFKYVNVVALTSNFIEELSIRGINQSMLFDTWVLGVQEALSEDN